MHKLDPIRGRQTDLPKRPIRVLGIDLGTTNSTVSQIVWDPAAPGEIQARCVDLEQETLQGTFSHVLVPSIVALQGNRVLIGEGAKRLRGQGLRKDQGIFYECKNDIGLNKTYHRAPEGFRSAAEIGGKVLAFLRDAVMRHSDQPVAGRGCEKIGTGTSHAATLARSTAVPARSQSHFSQPRTVVTVPASFQANQRQDTVRAAQLAGLDLAGGELLDEPVAAFIDYLMMKGTELVEKLATPKNLVVFDFGGGTCDVAVFRLEVLPQGGLQVSTLAVSRYHRLGGGDIDAAIVHEVLIPQLRRQNRMTEFELGFTEKKMAVEPALLGVAEQLKIGLCEEIRRLQAFGKYDDGDKHRISKTAPGSHRVTVDRRQLDLSSPYLTAAQFESLLEPFLDQDFLFARETEYRMTCSIFAPLQDAIDRSGVGERNVDLCLLVGGSSLIPQVVEAIDQYFPRASLLTYPDRDSVKACISRGAAYQALALAFQGRGLVQQVCHDDIAIRTGEGLLTLVPRGVSLPYPAGDSQYAVCNALGVPKALKARETCELRVELVAAAEGRTLYTEIWAIKGPAAAGAPLTLQYRLDENHVLELNLSRADGGESPPLKQIIDRPLSNVVNPGSKQLEILEIEENLKTAGWPAERMVREMAKLADLYSELNQTEKAISTLQAAQRLMRRADGDLLNKIGIFYGQLGDFEREERFLREAGAAYRGDAPWFNLALSKHRQKRTEEAIEAIEKVLTRAESGPSYVLRALLACEEGDEAAERRFLHEAMSRFHSPRTLSDWALGWCLTGARLIGDKAMTDAARQEIECRHRGGGWDVEQGILPQKISDGEASDG